MKARLLVVEDDLALRTGLRDAFGSEGYEVTAVQDGLQAEERLRDAEFDLVVLDLMLPLKGGLEVLRDLRARGDGIPVLLLTARGDVNDRVLGLELGADDYLTKPFNLRELVARVRALLRRRLQETGEDEDVRVTSFRVGDATVDLATFELSRGAEVTPLSPKEVAMLELLHRHAPGVVSRSDFLREVWGERVIVGNRTIDTHVLNLRHKLEADPRQPRHLVTVHGAGYRLVVDGSA